MSVYVCSLPPGFTSKGSDTFAVSDGKFSFAFTIAAHSKHQAKHVTLFANEGGMIAMLSTDGHTDCSETEASSAPKSRNRVESVCATSVLKVVVQEYQTARGIEVDETFGLAMCSVRGGVTE